MKILIAEDDEDIMTTYKLLFGSTKHQLFTANDGEEAVTIFDSEVSTIAGSHGEPVKDSLPFDLVILDYRMPKKNGIDVANHILSVAPLQKIILASAYTHELIEDRANKKTNLVMLQKPFEIDALLHLVEESTGESGKSRQTSASSQSGGKFRMSESN